MFDCVCECAIADTYVCMCLQIDSLRVNGTGDRAGKEVVTSGEKMARDQEKKKWASGMFGHLNCESLRRSEGVSMTSDDPSHPSTWSKSLWDLLLAFFTFLFGQHQRTLHTHEALLQTVAQISQLWLCSTLWNTNNVHFIKRFNIVLVFWEFSLKISKNTWRQIAGEDLRLKLSFK